jgi:hypothetical protein
LNSDGSPWTNNNVACDEIHEIAFFNNLAFVWPLNESVEAFQGTATPGTGTYQYQFDTTAVINPCHAPFTGLPTKCTGVHPQFPGANAGGMVGAMAIASAPGPDPTGTLWAIAPEPGEGGWGWFYAYAIDSTLGSQNLTYLWGSGTGLANCSSSPPCERMARHRLHRAHTRERRGLRDIRLLVTGTSTQYKNCLKVPSGNIASGILVFSTCP